MGIANHFELQFSIYILWLDHDVLRKRLQLSSSRIADSHICSAKSEKLWIFSCKCRNEYGSKMNYIIEYSQG